MVGLGTMATRAGLYGNELHQHALSVVGLEAVWYNTLLKHRFTDEEARHFLAGPAHAAWQWMQNLQDYGGPLPKSWIDSHIRLGKQIIQRELELGMQPIQQGFSGYVPRELKAKYPHAKNTATAFMVRFYRRCPARPHRLAVPSHRA